MSQLFANAARSPLMANILAGDTSLTVDAALADLYPVATTGTDPVPTVGKDFFKIVLENALHEKEIVYVRTRALGDPIFSNVLRGQEGTTARAYTTGDIVGLRHTSADLAGAIDLAVNATTAGKALLNAATAAAQRVVLGFSTFFSTLIVAADAAAFRALIGGAQAGSGIKVTQTVLEGPVDSSGYAAFGGAVGGATLTAAGTIKVAAAAGGDLSYVGSIVNPAFTSPGGSGTGYLMLSVTSAGVVTASVRSLMPTYQLGGTYSTTSGQFTHNIQESTSKVGNGATADQVYEVCIGECPHTAGVWSGTIVWYALKRQYYGEAAIPANGTAIVFSHKLGVPLTPLAQFQWGFKCETADAGSGAAVGDFLPMGPMDNGVSSAMGAFHGRLSSSVNGTYGSISPANKSSGSRASVTSVANFKAALYVSAGW